MAALEHVQCLSRVAGVRCPVGLLGVVEWGLRGVEFGWAGLSGAVWGGVRLSEVDLCRCLSFLLMGRLPGCGDGVGRCWGGLRRSGVEAGMPICECVRLSGGLDLF